MDLKGGNLLGGYDRHAIIGFPGRGRQDAPHIEKFVLDPQQKGIHFGTFRRGQAAQIRNQNSPGHAYEGLLLGTNNLLVGDSVGANNPRFVNMAARDYHVLTGSNILDAATSLGAGNPPVVEEYAPPQSSIARNVIGAAMDLGGVESSGTPPSPPVGGVIGFSALTYTVAENAGSINHRQSVHGG